VTGPRDTLLAALSPELVVALEALIDERVSAAATVAGDAGSPWLSIGEAAEYLRTSERTVERLIEKKRIRSSAIGRRRLLRRDDLDTLLRSGDEGGEVRTAPPRRRRGSVEARGPAV
jgi:excisionase family DNA binding protein